MFEDLTQAAHIAAGMAVPFEYAMRLVAEAEEYATARREQEYRDASRDIDNIVYGVDFGRR